MEREQLVRIALRYDTSMSHAMLRALGVPIPDRKPKPGTVVRVDRYEGVRELFKNKLRDGRDALDVL